MNRGRKPPDTAFDSTNLLLRLLFHLKSSAAAEA
jgi:hypothetical protein